MAGIYDVHISKTQDASSDLAVPITVNYSGGASHTTQNFTSGTSGWVDLGTSAFAAGFTGNVTMGYSGTATPGPAGSSFFSSMLGKH
jgi:hypothetical protein